MKDFKLNISTDDLKQYSLFIATPTYGGQCSTVYANAAISLGIVCATYGITAKFSFVTNESLVQRARNYLAQEFLESGMTHMVFIDADIKFDPMSVLVMLGIQTTHPEHFDILAAPYTKKGINWKKVDHYIDKVDDPKRLAKLSGDFVFNMVEGQTMTFDRPFEVTAAGTGFMLIPREVLTSYAEHYTILKYKPDHTTSEKFNGDTEITAFFHCDIDPETKRYLSEDYYFCHRAREIGKKVHMIPWIELTHNGNYDFNGSLVEEFKVASEYSKTKQSEVN